MVASESCLFLSFLYHFHFLMIKNLLTSQSDCSFFLLQSMLNKLPSKLFLNAVCIGSVQVSSKAFNVSRPISSNVMFPYDLFVSISLIFSVWSIHVYLSFCHHCVRLPTFVHVAHVLFFSPSSILQVPPLILKAFSYGFLGLRTTVGVKILFIRFSS